MRALRLVRTVTLHAPVALALVMLALAGCCGGTTTRAPSDGFDVIDVGPADGGPPDARAGTGRVGERPYRYYVPRHYDPTRPTPLLILLHGYGASGAAQDFYFDFKRLAEQRGFLYAYPDGLRDARGRRFWNAIPLPGEAGAALPDDVAYLTAIIDDLGARYNVDARRVYLVGHSNGAFLAYRYACEQPRRIAAIAGLAGAMLTDASQCSPSAPVAILHIHGDADTRIAYSGGVMRRVPYVGGCGKPDYPVPYLGAVDSVARWAGLNGCGPLEPTGTTLDLDPSLPDEETTVSRHDACAGGAAELWTIRGAGHLPGVGSVWASTIYDWLSAHARP